MAAAVVLVGWAPEPASGPWVGVQYVGELNHPVPALWISSKPLPLTSHRGEVPYSQFQNRFFVLTDAEFTAFANRAHQLRCPRTKINLPENNTIGISESDGRRDRLICETQGETACRDLIALAQAVDPIKTPAL